MTAGGFGLSGDASLQLKVVRFREVEAVLDDWSFYRHDVNNTGVSYIKGAVSSPDDLQLLWDLPLYDYGWNAQILATPGIADLNLDNKAEVIFNITNSFYGHHYYSIGKLVILDNELYREYGEIAWQGDIWGGFSSPAIDDLDEDGWKEIVIGSGNPLVPGFYIWRFGRLEFYPLDHNAPINSSPVLYDLNGDGYLEIILQSGGLGFGEYRGCFDYYYQGKGPIVYDWLGNLLWIGEDPTLSLVLGSPTYVGSSSTPAVGDIDGDGEPEIVSGFVLALSEGGDTIYLGGVHAFEADGSLKWSYHTDFTKPPDTETFKYGPVEGSVVISDLEGDGYSEIIFQQANPSNLGIDIDSGLIVLEGRDGSVKWTSSTYNSGLNYTWRGMSPVVEDVDGDGLKGVFILGADFDHGQMYLVGFDAFGYLLWPPLPLWGIWDDWYPVNASPTLVDLDNDGILEVVIIDNSGGWSMQIIDGARGTLEWELDYLSYTSIAFGDLNGDGGADFVIPYTYYDYGLIAFSGPAISVEGGVITQEVLWSETNYPVISSGDSLSLSHLIYPYDLTDPGATGELYWHGKLSNSLGQVLAKDKQTFWRRDAAVSVLLSTDQNKYKLGSVFHVKSKVVNLSETRLENLILNYQVIAPEGLVILSGNIGPFDLDLNQSLEFSLGKGELLVAGDYKVEAQVSQYNILKGEGVHYFWSIVPLIHSEFEGPNIVGDEDFDLYITLTNLTDMTLDLNLDVISWDIESRGLISDFESDALYQHPLNWEIEGNTEVWGDGYNSSQSLTLYTYPQSQTIVWREIEIPANSNYLTLYCKYQTIESVGRESMDVFQVRIFGDFGEQIGCQIDELSSLLEELPDGTRYLDWRRCEIDVSEFREMLF